MSFALRTSAACMLVAGALSTPAQVEANGRFPAAQHVIVGPGANDDLIALRTTFGLLVSRDSGRTFGWICEEALDYSGLWDPPIAMGASGAITVGLPDGITHTRDGCAFQRVASAGNRLVQDLANDAAGTTVIGVEAVSGTANHVLQSDDQGATFRPLGPGVRGALFATLDAAPSRPARVYATAIDESTRGPMLFRSDDGGATLERVLPDLLGSSDAFLSAIDPNDPDRIWLRGNRGLGTQLLRSDDRGDTFVRALETTGSMLGFAISDDGARIWAGGPDDGLFRSDDGGRTFAHVHDLHVTCLRYHRGALYLCADWLRESFALARWRDGEPGPVPLIAFHDVTGALSCPAGTTTTELCEPRWSTVRQMFPPRPRIDAGGAERVDAMVADGGAFDASGNDLGGGIIGDVGGESGRTPGTCACRALPAGRGVPGNGFAAAVLVALGLCGGQRRRQSATVASIAAPASG